MNDLPFGAKPGSLLAATLLTLSVHFPAAAQDMSDSNVMTSQGDLVVHPIHHASLTLTWLDMTVLVDPAPAPGASEGSDVTAEYKALAAPNLIVVTHEHADHFNADILKAIPHVPIIAPQSVADKMPEDLKSRTTVLANGESKAVSDILTVDAVPAYNITPDRLTKHPQGRDNGYVLTFGATRVYVAGDTEDTPEMRALTGIDVAFLPMNLPYTMDVEHAADAVKAFGPTIVFPYHYGQSDVHKFKTLVGDASDVRLLKCY
jgi:L-ascorbate metabolism protein UlaG (beta-lactamase superfamily)